VRYIYAPNPSPNDSRNKGIEAARGELIAFLDADDLWLPEKLEKQVSLIREDPTVGLVYSGMYRFDSETGAILSQHPIKHCPSGHVLRQLYFWQFVPSPTPLIRREVFNKVGVFNPALRGCDDWDMWLRIAARFDFDRVPLPLAKYRVHVSQNASSVDSDQYERDMMAFFERVAKQYPDELGRIKQIRCSKFQQELGWRLVQRGQWAGGVRRLRRAFEFAPFRLGPYIFAVLSLVAKRVSEERYSHSVSSYHLGKHCLINGWLSEARLHFWEAIRLDPVLDWRCYAGLILTFVGNDLLSRVSQHLNLNYVDDNTRPETVRSNQW
jgi:glycosyltransferase involved in cell wall biosynthesis